MPKRWLILGILGVGLLAALIFVLPRSRPTEPTWAGRSLSAWVNDFREPDRARVLQASEAVKHIGTNAIPFLLEWMHYEEPIARNARMSLPSFLRPSPRATRERDTAKHRRTVAAAEALRSLGPEAKSAVPELRQMLADSKGQLGAYVAANALVAIDPDARTPLLAALNNQNAAVRMASVHAISLLHSNALPAVPTLVACLTDPVSGVRSQATNALRKIAPEVLTNAPSK